MLICRNDPKIKWVPQSQLKAGYTYKQVARQHTGTCLLLIKPFIATVGVGRVSEASRNIKESWPIGSPCWILEQNLFLLSSLQASANLFCTVSLNRRSSHFWVSVLFQMALDALGKVVLLMSISDYLAGRRMLLVAIVIPASF